MNENQSIKQIEEQIKVEEEHLRRMSMGGGLSSSNYLHLCSRISDLQDLKSRRMKLRGYSLDEPGRELYAREIGPSGEINREWYITQARHFLTRASQIRTIDRLLVAVGFKDYHVASILTAFSDWVEGCLSPGSEFPHYRLYNNRKGNDVGTRVRIKPEYRMDYSGIIPKKDYDGLFIEVGKTGSFEDYVWTCNLFRKYFGLKEREIFEEPNKE